MNPADVIRIKVLLPTDLGSAEIRERIAIDILRRSIFSARMTFATFLAKIRDVCAQMMAGQISQATARDILGGVLEQIGHSPLDDGGIKNPASMARLNLIIDTQSQMAASVARLESQTDAVVAMWPAWRLVRLEGRGAPRQDWPERWAAAGSSCGFEGALQDRFIALKSSPIWQALGDGAGGYRDTLGNPYPPFAFGSGMGWEDVTREECEELGLHTGGAIRQRLEVPSLAPDRDELVAAADKWGFSYDEIAGGIA